MVNAPGEKAYPIAGPSWVLIYQHSKNPDQVKSWLPF